MKSNPKKQEKMNGNNRAFSDSPFVSIMVHIQELTNMIIRFIYRGVINQWYAN